MPEVTCRNRSAFCLWCREPIIVGDTMVIRSGSWRYELYHPDCSGPAFTAQRERKGTVFGTLGEGKL